MNPTVSTWPFPLCPFKGDYSSQVQRHMTVPPAPGRLGQEHPCELKAGLGYIHTAVSSRPAQTTVSGPRREVSASADLRAQTCCWLSWFYFSYSSPRWGWMWSWSWKDKHLDTLGPLNKSQLVPLVSDQNQNKIVIDPLLEKNLAIQG